LNTAAANLNEASSVVVSSVRSPTQLSSSSKDFSVAFHDLLGVSMEMAGQTQDTEIRGQMVHSLKSVSTTSSSLLTTAKSLSADPYLPNGKNQLAAAARAVTDSINHLVNVCTSAAPGQNECDNAIRKIQAMKHLLENPTEPINDCSYYEALDSVIDKSKILGDCMTGITNSAKQSQHERFAEHIKTFSSSICNFIEASAQAAYLVKICRYQFVVLSTRRVSGGRVRSFEHRWTSRSSRPSSIRSCLPSHLPRLFDSVVALQPPETCPRSRDSHCQAHQRPLQLLQSRQFQNYKSRGQETVRPERQSCGQLHGGSGQRDQDSGLGLLRREQAEVRASDRPAAR
jgi:hypothetical protein